APAEPPRQARLEPHPPFSGQRLGRHRSLQLAVRRTRAFPWWLAGALPVTVVILGTFFALLHYRKPIPCSASTKAASTTEAPEVSPRRIVVRKLAVEHYAAEKEGDRPKGLLGEKSFTTHPGDKVTVHAELSEPAFCYLIAYRPDG